MKSLEDLTLMGARLEGEVFAGKISKEEAKDRMSRFLGDIWEYPSEIRQDAADIEIELWRNIEYV